MLKWLYWQGDLTHENPVENAGRPVTELVLLHQPCFFQWQRDGPIFILNPHRDVQAIAVFCAGIRVLYLRFSSHKKTTPRQSSQGVWQVHSWENVSISGGLKNCFSKDSPTCTHTSQRLRYTSGHLTITKSRQHSAPGDGSVVMCLVSAWAGAQGLKPASLLQGPKHSHDAVTASKHGPAWMQPSGARDRVSSPWVLGSLRFQGIKPTQRLRAKVKVTESILQLTVGHIKGKCESESCSLLSDFLRPPGESSPWDSPGENTGVGSCSLLQGIFPTQGSNLGLVHCRQIVYQLSYWGSPRILE